MIDVRANLLPLLRVFGVTFSFFLGGVASGTLNKGGVGGPSELELFVPRCVNFSCTFALMSSLHMCVRLEPRDRSSHGWVIRDITEV